MVSTLKRICEALSISSASIIFGDMGSNDLQVLVERLERLLPDQYTTVEKFLNHIFELYAHMGCYDGNETESA